MPIPDFQTLMRPLLALHEDGVEKTQAELRDALAREFELTPAELGERIPSGLANTFANRVAWASTHMKQAGLIEKPRRGVSVITDRGRNVLTEYPDRVEIERPRTVPRVPGFPDTKSAPSSPTDERRACALDGLGDARRDA